jgi:hypothetical protein
MEDELLAVLYRVITHEAMHRPRRRRLQFGDWLILLVACWATLRDRPISWAIDPRNWPPRWHWLSLPSAATMSVRLRSLSVQLLREAVFHRLLAATVVQGFCLCRRIDSKPLPVGGFSKDPDARWGYALSCKCRGYKLFCCWGKPQAMPEAIQLGAMNCSDQAGAMSLVDGLEHVYGRGRMGGYLLADATHDTNPLHACSSSQGLQLLAPRKCPGSGLGHCTHAASRLRSIELLEGPDDPWIRASNPSARHRFGPSLYRHRGQIERDLAGLTSFGGGLQPLPSWVRHPRRVARWTIIKLIINGLRICKSKGLTP